jgi:hypothetical protein
MTTVDSLLEGRTRLDGRDVAFVLGITRFEELATFLQGRPRNDEEAQIWMGSRLYREIAQLDGSRLRLDQARKLVAAAQVVGDFVNARNRLHDEARQRGMLFALCPGCKSTEAEVSFMYLVLRLQLEPPTLTTPDGMWLMPPAIGRPAKLVRGMRRGDLPLAAKIRFELPSTRMGLGASDRPTGGTLAVLDEDREEAAWEKFWPEGSRTPRGHAWWYTESVQFRAEIRLSAAIEDFDRGGAPSPAFLETLPAFDVEFLDMAVMATQFTNEPREETPEPGVIARPRNLPVTCATCQTQYLPLL